VVVGRGRGAARQIYMQVGGHQAHMDNWHARTHAGMHARYGHHTHDHHPRHRGQFWGLGLLSSLTSMSSKPFLSDFNSAAPSSPAEPIERKPEQKGLPDIDLKDDSNPESDNKLPGHLRQVRYPRCDGGRVEEMGMEGF